MPSQIEAVAQKAGKAFPAVAIAGVLAVGSQAHASPRSQAHASPRSQAHASPRSQAHASLGSSRSALPPSRAGYAPMAAAFQPARLSAVARQPAAARPARLLANARADRPKHADASGSSSSRPQAPEGTLGCGALEALWREAGGSPSAQVTAASIAMAESSGEQYATGPYGERGYWQINPDHGTLSTYDAYGNARAAVIISDDGSNWSPWTTFVDGAYLSRC